MLLPSKIPKAIYIESYVSNQFVNSNGRVTESEVDFANGMQDAIPDLGSLSASPIDF